MGRTYARDEINSQANTPSPLLAQSSVQKGGAYFWELMIHLLGLKGSSNYNNKMTVFTLLQTQ